MNKISGIDVYKTEEVLSPIRSYFMNIICIELLDGQNPDAPAVIMYSCDVSKQMRHGRPSGKTTFVRGQIAPESVNNADVEKVNVAFDINLKTHETGCMNKGNIIEIDVNGKLGEVDKHGSFDSPPLGGYGNHDQTEEKVPNGVGTNLDSITHAKMFSSPADRVHLGPNGSKDRTLSSPEDKLSDNSEYRDRSSSFGSLQGQEFQQRPIHHGTPEPYISAYHVHGTLSSSGSDLISPQSRPKQNPGLLHTDGYKYSNDLATDLTGDDSEQSKEESSPQNTNLTDEDARECHLSQNDEHETDLRQQDDRKDTFFNGPNSATQMVQTFSPSTKDASSQTECKNITDDQYSSSLLPNSATWRSSDSTQGDGMDPTTSFPAKDGNQDPNSSSQSINGEKHPESITQHFLENTVPEDDLIAQKVTITDTHDDTDAHKVFDGPELQPKQKSATDDVISGDEKTIHSSGYQESDDSVCDDKKTKHDSCGEIEPLPDGHIEQHMHSTQCSSFNISLNSDGKESKEVTINVSPKEKGIQIKLIINGGNVTINDNQSHQDSNDVQTDTERLNRREAYSFEEAAFSGEENADYCVSFPVGVPVDWREFNSQDSAVSPAPEDGLERDIVHSPSYGPLGQTGSGSEIPRDIKMHLGGTSNGEDGFSTANQELYIPDEVSTTSSPEENKNIRPPVTSTPKTSVRNTQSPVMTEGVFHSDETPIKSSFETQQNQHIQDGARTAARVIDQGSQTEGWARSELPGLEESGIIRPASERNRLGSINDVSERSRSSLISTSDSQGNSRARSSDGKRKKTKEGRCRSRHQSRTRSESNSESQYEDQTEHSSEEAKTPGEKRRTLQERSPLGLSRKGDRYGRQPGSKEMTMSAIPEYYNPNVQHLPTHYMRNTSLYHDVQNLGRHSNVTQAPHHSGPPFYPPSSYEGYSMIPTNTGFHGSPSVIPLPASLQEYSGRTPSGQASSQPPTNRRYNSDPGGQFLFQPPMHEMPIKASYGQLPRQPPTVGGQTQFHSEPFSYRRSNEFTGSPNQAYPIHSPRQGGYIQSPNGPLPPQNEPFRSYNESYFTAAPPGHEKPRNSSERRLDNSQSESNDCYTGSASEVSSGQENQYFPFRDEKSKRLFTKFAKSIGFRPVDESEMSSEQ